jgi:hypothetical protein
MEPHIIVALSATSHEAESDESPGEITAIAIRSEVEIV